MSGGPPRPSGVIRAVIFDIGRVIVRINIPRSFAALGTSLGLSPEEVLSSLQRDPVWEDWEDGRVEPHAWHQHVMQRFHLSLSFEEFCATWNRALDPDTILKDDLFAALSRRCRLALLSNTDPIHVANMQQNFSFIRYFPVRVYSCVVGATKPSPVIYRKALSELNVAPNEAFYTDDLEPFVEAARQLGIHGFHFRGPDSLDAELRRLGLLENE